MDLYRFKLKMNDKICENKLKKANKLSEKVTNIDRELIDKIEMRIKSKSKYMKYA